MPKITVPKITVALLFGGRSSEHTISCATAGGVLSAIDREKYDILPIGITGEGDGSLAEYANPGHVDAQLIDDVATWVKAH